MGSPELGLSQTPRRPPGRGREEEEAAADGSMGPCCCELLSSCSRLHSNHLFCDCHLAWLSQWLRQRPTIGLFTQCSGPASLRGLNVAEVQKSEFSCSGGCCVPCLCPLLAALPALPAASFCPTPLLMMSTYTVYPLSPPLSALHLLSVIFPCPTPPA